MPQTNGGDAGAAWADALRRFHLTGEDAAATQQDESQGQLQPAALIELLTPERIFADYPLLLCADEAEAEGLPLRFSAVVAQALDELGQAGEQVSVLQEHVPRLVSMAGKAVEGRSEAVPLREVIEEICTGFLGAFEISEAARQELEEQLSRLRSRLASLPASAALLGLGEHTAVTLAATILRQRRRPEVASFERELTSLLVQLSQQLQVDSMQAPEATSSKALSSTMGAATEALVDLDAMSKGLKLQRGSKRMDAQRRERIETAVVALQRYLDQPPAPELVLVHAGSLPQGMALSGIRVVEDGDPAKRAVALFEELAAPMLEVFRAVRVARLELRRAYQPEVHDKTLQRLDRRSLAADELLALPPVLVLQTAEQFHRQSLGWLGQLLANGQPIQFAVLEQDCGICSEEAGQASAYHLDLAQVAMAHREATVVRSTLAEPEHLRQGLRTMASSLRPGVAALAVPTWQSQVSPGIQLAAAHLGRATPCFTYDPEAGTSFSDCLDLSHNPQPERVWPSQNLAFFDSERAEQTRTTDFTFADAAALQPSCRADYRVIPPQAWSEEQSELSDFLAAPESQQSSSLPFIWVVDAEGTLGRAVVSRHMVSVCQDRVRAWRVLQELGGLDNAYARRAAEEAREQAAAEVEKATQELQAAHAEELEKVRQEAAGEAMENLANVLLNVDAMPLAAAPKAVAAAPAAVAEAEAAEAAPAAAPVEEEEEAVGFDEPFIDSELCTTCNECTNLNGSLFKYNDNKQAYIADAAAGTFAQLVQAAEKCPAKCIHPGKPRSDDSSATDEMIAKAAKFN